MNFAGAKDLVYYARKMWALKFQWFFTKINGLNPGEIFRCWIYQLFPIQSSLSEIGKDWLSLIMFFYRFDSNANNLNIHQPSEFSRKDKNDEAQTF